jgi:hypothetical protein
MALMPDVMREFLVRQMNPVKRRLAATHRLAEAYYGGPLPVQSSYEGRYPVTLGILKDRANYYVYNLVACREMGVPFRVLDLEKSNWVEWIAEPHCDAFLAWPSCNLSIWKDLYDERLPLLAAATGKPIVPSCDEIWFWESKRRMRDWLLVHNIPHPSTEVFYNEEEAFDFASRCDLPVVVKSNSGASSHGIFVLRNRRRLQRMVRRAFGRGLRKRWGDGRDREWGFIIFQEFIPHDFEWRIVRIGSSFLCRRKVRRGDFASGNGLIEWGSPASALLDFVRDVTDQGGFQSMALDVFVREESTSGPRFLVNELQTLVGAKELPDHPARGRWKWSNQGWQFEAGDFYRNACANLRIGCLLELLGIS